MAEKLTATIEANAKGFLDALKTSIDKLSQASAELDKVSGKSGQASDALDKVSGAAKNTGNAAGETASKVRDAAKAMEATAESGESVSEALDRHCEALKDVRSGYDELCSSTASMISSFAKGASASETVSKGIGSVAQAFGATGPQAAIMIAAVEAIGAALNYLSEQAIKARKNVVEMTLSVIEYDKKQAEETNKVQDAQRKELETLANLTRQGELSNVQKQEQIELLEQLRDKYSELEDAAVNSYGHIVDAQGNVLDMDALVASSMDKSNEDRMAQLQQQMKSMILLERQLKAYYDALVNSGGEFKKGGATSKEMARVQYDLAQNAKKMKAVVAEQTALSKKAGGEEYLKRQDAAKRDADAAKHNAAVEKLSELKKQQNRGALSRFDQRRAELNDTVAEMSGSLNSDELADLEVYRLQELAKINEEEKAEFQRLQDDKLKIAQKAEDDRLKMLQAAEKERETAEQRYQDALAKMAEMASADEERRLKEETDRKAQILNDANKELDRKISGFGFRLNDDLMGENNSQRIDRKKTQRLDAGIADKMARLERGQKVHFTTREKSRIDELRQLQGEKNQNNAQLEQMKAAELGKVAADAAEKAAKEHEKAADELQQAAEALQMAGDKLEMTKQDEGASLAFAAPARIRAGGIGAAATAGRNAAGAETVAETAGVAAASPLAETVAETSGIAAATLATSEGAVSSGAADYTTILGQMLTELQALKSNTYIVR